MKKIFLVCATSLCLGAVNLVADITQDQMVDTSAYVVKKLRLDKKAQEFNFDYLKQAEAIAIIPNTIKTGVVLSYQSGKGIFIMKNNNGTWSSPVFVNFNGYGAGIQAGYESADLVLFFMTRRSFDGIFDGECTLDVTADATIGKGYKTVGLTDAPEISANVLGYAKTTGVFIGASFENAKINVDDQDNLDYYGRIYDYKDILSNSPKESSHTKNLKNVLNKYFR